MSEKWIILTTIFYPTSAVDRFLSLDEWSLVVIGDRKTPNDWLSRVDPNLRHKVIYLSLSDQKNLNYGIVQFLPENSYARKNIGYLVAIQCGAKIIFESDDDNILEDMFIKVLPKVSKPDSIPNIAFHGERSPFINIYGSFGEPNIWPRGFPIEELKNISEDGWSSLRQNHGKIYAYVQQFLADLDPDVDAIYRLANPLNLGHIRFRREQTPIALEPFTFSPYNTQNTITHYEAFWGLFLPVTTTFRVCDIWRGFWVQRLLWDIGGQLVFAAPTVKQKRNVHSYLKDMKEEQQMYDETSSFIRFLHTWRSTATSLFERIHILAHDITHAGFWNAEELNYLDIWLEDLRRVGYKPPPVILSSKKTRNPLEKKQAAVCVTGRLGCMKKTWNSFEKELRASQDEDIDIFFYLSSSLPISSCNCIHEIYQYNTTVQVLYAEHYSLSQTLNKACDIKSNLSKNEKKACYQEFWVQKKCYDLVNSFQKENNIRYEQLVQVQFGSNFAKTQIPRDRDSSLNVNVTIKLSYDVHKGQQECRTDWIDASED